jgi:hypothetical protein
MAMILRAAGALVFGAAMAAGAFASPAMEAAVRDSAWADQTVAAVDLEAPEFERHDPGQVVVDDAVAAASCDGSCSNAVDCGDSLCDCGSVCGSSPVWFASAGAVILHRDRPAPGTVVAGNPSGVPFSSASDFGFGWDIGPDVALARRFASGLIVEGRYFRVDSVAANSFFTPGNFIGAGFTGPGGTFFAGRYLTKLDSSEINLRSPVGDRLSLLGGFRWVELKDEMVYKLNGNVATGDYEYNNRLYGGQVGASLNLAPRPSSPVLFNVEGKAGLYGNVADGGIFEFQGNNFIGSFVGRETHAAFVGQIDITTGYRLTKHLAVYGGYSLLWLDGLALAGDAASRSLLNPSLLRSVDTHGNVFYNGALTGIDVTW